VIEAKSRSPVGSAKQRLHHAGEVRETIAHQEEPAQRTQTKQTTANYTTNAKSKLYRFQRGLQCIMQVNVLILWPWSTACSTWTHVWYTNAKRFQSLRLRGVRLWSLIKLQTM